MKRGFFFVIVFSLFVLSACSPLTGLEDLVARFTDQEPAPMETSLPVPVVTDTSLAATETIAGPPKPTETDPMQPLNKPVFEKADKPGTYWVNNPTSQARLFVQVVHAPDWGGEALPALVLVPGGISTGGNLLPDASKLAEQGFTVFLFDPDGRGRSEGVEDYGGFIHQDGLAAVLQFAAGNKDVQSGRMGLVSYSYGVTMATGVLARYPQLDVRFLIDWEGPVDRADTTTSPAGECVMESTRQMWQPCDDQQFWVEREAIRFISQVKIPAYQRLQSENDHVQPDVSHAIRIVNEAVNAGIGWVRLNDLPANQIYDENDPPKMTPEQMDKTREKRIAEFARELFRQFGD